VLLQKDQFRIKFLKNENNTHFNLFKNAMGIINYFFIDETGFQVVMHPFYGYSQANTTAITTSPMIRYRNFTVMACLSETSLFYYQILEVPGNRVNFYDFLNNLCNYCDSLEYTNCIFVMDNAKFHHCQEIKDLATSRNFELMFLPAYTPIFNPIENLFSQWKNLVRRRNCRNEDELFNVIHNFESIVTEDDCKNYVSHCKNTCFNYLDPNFRQ
jgi:transposase